MKRIILAVIISISVLASGKSEAALINGGFENLPNLTGWNWTNYANVTSASFMTAHSGSKLGRICTWTTAPGNYQTLSQTLALSAGDRLDGWVRMFSTETYAYRDDGYLKILQGDSLIANIWSRGNPHATFHAGTNPQWWGATEWTAWELTAPFDGEFRIEAGVRNNVDSLRYTQVHLDDITLTENSDPVSTPEPATFSLLGLGLLGLFKFGRRKVA